MSDNLKAAALAANLQGEQKRQVDNYSKALTVHQELLNLPREVATAVYNTKTDAQKEDLKNKFGEEDPDTKPSRGWLGTAWHYASAPVVLPVKYAFKGLIELSDAMTRVYRSVAIPIINDGRLGFAWDEANDKGDKVFNEGRIEKARLKFGRDAVDIAVRIASGEEPEKIFKTATEEQKKYIMLADPTNKVIPGIADVENARGLFNETLAAVDAAKFSPGRQLANLILPGQLEGSGLAYNITSGVTDAAYRLFADPLVVASKIRSLYVVANYSLDVVTGGKKVSETFARKNVKSFWDTYGATLDKLTKAQASGKVTNEAVEARRQLEILAPEFGREVIKVFQKAEIKDAKTAEAFFLNTEEAAKIVKGAIGRRRVLIPTMGPLRKARVSIVTTADRVIDLDRFAPRIVDDIYGGPATDDGILKILSSNPEELGRLAREVKNQKIWARPTMATIAARIDKAKAKFNIAPLFKDDQLDLKATDAGLQIYRLARLVLPKQDSRMISEVFESTDDIGKRKEIAQGLWATIAEARGLNLTAPGQKINRTLQGLGDSRFSVGNFGDDFIGVGSIPSDFSTVIAAPSLVDIDRAAARSGLIQKMLGQANKEWVDKMTGYWSFLTLAGPRYALRNAGEDLMVHLAIGGSPWGLAKGRYLATRVNTALEGARKTSTWNDNPLGSVLRIINKKEAARFEAELAGLDDVIRTAREEIKVLRSEIKAAKTPADKALLESRIEALKTKTAGGTVEQTRRIMATALTSGRINRYRAAIGKKPMFEDEAAILSEHLIYGNLDNSLALVSEGGFNFATGADYITRTTLFTRGHGVRSAALVFDDPAAVGYAISKKDAGAAAYVPRSMQAQDEAGLIGWMMRMTYYANDELGAVAVANLDDKKVAIAKIMEWMKQNPTFRTEAQLAARNIDERQHAEIVYQRAREIFETRKVGKNGEKLINVELLNKIRTRNDDGDWVVSGRLSLDDLPKNSNDIPEMYLGPALVPVAESGQYTSSVMTKGWTWLGMANARMSRQPIVFNEIIKLRKQMQKSGMEDAYLQSVLSKVDPTDAKKVQQATIRAKREYAQLIEDRAVAQTLAYVDNPLIRTQLAFSARNFSRFYRATEDMYRRFYRAVRYNPSSFRKAALTIDGIAHNGWIQEDDQGEKYFVYPGLEPVYRAVQFTMQALGVDAEFKTPMPVQFGGSVKMLTPSLNQDSILPTFNGPLAGISIKTLSNLVDVFGAPGAADTITQVGLGKYAVDRSFVSSFLPAHVNRIYETMSTDDRNSQYASAWRKAVTYLEASGNGLPEKYDEAGNLIPPTIQEQEVYRQKIKNTTLSILGTRFIYGFVAPASPQVELKAEMAKWIKDNNRANFKQAWNNLLDQYPGDYDAAMAKWVELFPNQIPFTIPESEKKTVAVIKYAEESGAFVEQNADLFKRYPQGAAFLIPHKSGFSWDAYKTMKDMGLKYNKRVDDYLLEVQTASDLQQYYSKKNEYESSLEGMITDYERTAARKEFQDWAKIFKAGRPLVQEELSQGGQKAIERIKAIDDLRLMLNDPKVRVRGPVQKSLKDMLDLYDTYKLQKEAFSTLSGSSNIVAFMKDSTIVKMRELSKANENTMSAYNTLFASLLGDTNG